MSKSAVYKYQKSDSGEWELWLDGEKVLAGTECDCWNHIHEATDFSVWFALKHMGYVIKAPEKTVRIM